MTSTRVETETIRSIAFGASSKPRSAGPDRLHATRATNYITYITVLLRESTA